MSRLIFADRASLLEINHAGLDEARNVILADMLGERPLRTAAALV